MPMSPCIFLLRAVWDTVCIALPFFPWGPESAPGIMVPRIAVKEQAIIDGRTCGVVGEEWRPCRLIATGQARLLCNHVRVCTFFSWR